MKVNLKILIVETSPIIRSGLEVELKKISGFRFEIIEIMNVDLLAESVRMHKPDLLIINPNVQGNILIHQIKEDCDCPYIKCIALLNNLTDKAQLVPFDEQISIYDTSEDIRMKLEALCSDEINEVNESEEQQVLSPREKEIIVCVVKGMTNREIADHLFLSAHTVITHRRNIARKLQIHSASGLTVYAIVNKLVELSEIGK